MGSLNEHNVTLLCGAPVVMDIILSVCEENADIPTPSLAHRVEFFTAAAPPPERTLARMKNAGFNVTHLYGLAEVYGPAVVNEWHREWDTLPAGEQAALKARQGVRYLPLESLDVLDPSTMKPVPCDGTTLGEVMFRGNVVMKGYFKNPQATEEAFKDGWFHSGDLAVKHPDGYIQLKDRSKDIIISGGENISLSRLKRCFTNTRLSQWLPLSQSRMTSGGRLLLHSWNATTTKLPRRRAALMVPRKPGWIQSTQAFCFYPNSEDTNRKNPEIPVKSAVEKTVTPPNHRVETGHPHKNLRR